MTRHRLKRGAGILMAISSLPSPYGIGTLGKEAYHFVDQLAQAGQTYWQVLPIGPTGYGDSPYQSFSTFAGNPYFIDLDMLTQEGLLEPEDIAQVDWGSFLAEVDYRKIYENRFRLLRKAYFRCGALEQTRMQTFRQEQGEWLSEYALFMACKDYFGGKPWRDWEEGIRSRRPEALRYFSEMLQEKAEFWEFVQYKFFQQWDRLKRYANQQGIRMIGDIPIYVAMDSVDVWANTAQYQLNEMQEPAFVAGCPPDAFSDYGQKWGNPLYDWDKMEQDGFVWWKQRMRAAAKRYDVIRIDHFIGIVRYFAIPADQPPVAGQFREGPGMKLLRAIDDSLDGAQIIAEDLGVLVPRVREVLAASGYPGMKVLEFAFDGRSDNEYLPHCYERNCVVYSGTHDNETLRGYFGTLSPENLAFLCDYAGEQKKENLVRRVVQMAYESVADTVIIQMQDILEKDNAARMNLPSTIGKNWRWRMKTGEFSGEAISWLHRMAQLYDRLPEYESNQRT